MDKKKLAQIIASGILFLITICSGIQFETIKIVLFALCYIISGYDVIIEAVKNIFKGRLFDESFLMTIATIGAFAIKEYPEAIAVMLFYKVGELFEDYATDKSRKSITDLMDIRPDFANIQSEDGNLKKVNPKDVKIGDIIVIKPGEKIPLDGVIIEGKTTLDTSALTGEAMPREANIGEKIISGCINLTGIISVKVEKEFGESTVSKIINLVQNASNKKAETENFITKFSKIYTPIVVLSALLIAIIPGFILKIGTSYEWIYRALTFLVISCPCALVISVPLSFFGGIGGASKSGILIKGGNYIDTLSKVSTVVFDKTGTLTKGKFEVKEIIPSKFYLELQSNNLENDFKSKNTDEQEKTQSQNIKKIDYKSYNSDENDNELKNKIIEYAVYAENYSNHPIASSVKKMYRDKIDTSKISDINEIAGKGIECKVSKEKVVVGNLELMKEKKVQYFEKELVFFNNECNSENQNNIKDKFKNSIVTPIGSLKENTMNSISGTILYVAVDNKYIGKIIIADQEKEDSRYAINNLKKLGITDIIMLTGDKKQIAEKVAKDLKINKVYAELLPTEKVKKIENLLTNNVKNRLGKVAFVGDGINDAPVLARADIGIAMGGLGSDAAIEASDIVVMTDEPSKVAKAIRIAKNTIKIAKENITFAIMIKILILILSAFGIATMWEAVFADVGVTIIAVLNSFRTMNTKKI